MKSEVDGLTTSERPVLASMAKHYVMPTHHNIYIIFTYTIYIVSIAYNALYAYTLTTYHMYMYVLIFTFTLKFIYTDCFSTERHVGAGRTGVIKFLTT